MQKHQTSPLWRRAPRVFVLGVMTIGVVYGFFQIPAIPRLVLIAAISFVILHEAAHAMAMRELGIEVKEFGLGIPKGIFRRLQVPIRLPWLSYPIMLSPLLISAYVLETKEGKERLEALPYADRAFVFGAGVLANIITAIVFWFGFGLWDLWLTEDLTPLPRVLLMLVISYALVKLMVTFRRGFCAYVFPVFGLGVVALIVYMVVPAFAENFAYAVMHGGSTEGGLAVLLGPITLVKSVGNADSLFAGYFWLYVLASGLAMTNLLPLPMLDGGQIVGSLLRERFGRMVEVGVLAGSTLVIGLPLVVLISLQELGAVFGSLAIIGFVSLVAYYAWEKRTEIFAEPKGAT